MSKSSYYITAVLLLVAFTSGWIVQGWRMQAQIERVTATYSQELEERHAQALNDYLEMERVKDEAIQEAKLQADKNAAAADAARANADRLRRDLARVPASISTATRTAVDEYAATASELLGECSAEITKLARAADGHANDAALMLKAWPTPSRQDGGK